MVFSYRTSILISLIVLALMVGCSGGNSTPVTPDNTDVDLTANVSDYVGAGNTYIWELGEVVLDTEELTAEVVPLRTSQFTLNIVKFLQPPAGNPANLSVNFDVAGSDFANAFVDLDATLNHPFPGTDYWGFDVRVIVFGSGSTTGKHDTSVRYPAVTELRMENADGYTRWWNHDEFGPPDKIFGYTDGVMSTPVTNYSIVNGFKYFANGIGAQTMPPDPAEATRGVFDSGSVTREMLLQFPQVAQPFRFKYSVAASWNAPSTSPPTDVDDFDATANQQEAYQIVVTQDPASTAFYDDTVPQWGGDLILDIEVWDWQADGDPASEIAGIYVESPTLLSNQGDMVEITATWTESAGSSPNSVVYSGTLANLTPDAVEDQELMITVLSADPTSYEPPLPGFLYPSSDLAAYQLFFPTILDSGTPPEKTITVTDPDGGETMIVGDPYTITWNWTGTFSNVLIEYNTDGSDTLFPNTVVLSAPNTGSFVWDSVADTPSTTCKIRITEDPPDVAQDISDDNFTISTSGDTGWNVVPGQQTVELATAPNQSTVMPDLGIQNDGAGAEGAWVVDQEGGIADGSPYYFDYLLDWSGPGGNAYPSGFNYNVAPFGRHDCSAQGGHIAGCSFATEQINPPVYNDEFTALWWLSWLKDDETATTGQYTYVIWGDSGSGDPGDPPENDPDEDPWVYTADVSSGLYNDVGYLVDNAPIFVTLYSDNPAAPDPGDDSDGDIWLGFWAYPYLTSPGIYRLPVEEYTTDEEFPLFEAFDVSDKTMVRAAADTDSHITFGEFGDGTPADGTATFVYMLDSLGNWYGSGFQVDNPVTQYFFIGLTNSMKMRPEYGDDLYYDGGTAVDLTMLPTTEYLHEGDWELGFNWNAVLYDTGDGNWVVRIYEIDWTTAEPEDEIIIIDTTDPIEGTPIAIDCDPVNFTLHVISEDGGTYYATIFDYTE